MVFVEDLRLEGGFAAGRYLNGKPIVQPGKDTYTLISAPVSRQYYTDFLLRRETFGTARVMVLAFGLTVKITKE